ncbi:DNA mismatch repair protein, partial [Tulasnella sp. 427]
MFAPMPSGSRSNPVDLEPSSNKARSRTAVGQLVPESQTALVSINDLRAEIKKKRHGGFSETVEKHTFVGVVDFKLSLALIQHSTKLYLVNYGSLAEEMFYQLGVRQFGNFGRIKLEPPPPLPHLIRLAVEAEEERLIVPYTQTITKLILERAELLDEYFSIKVNQQTGEVEALPCLLKEYTPNLDRLPQFLMRLGPEIDWTDEKGCFETLLREIAYFHRPGPLESFIDVEPSEGGCSDADERAAKWEVEHVLFPAMRKYLSPPKSLLEGDVVQVANLPD